MTPAELMACPGWPSAMDRDAAVKFLGGSPAFFAALEAEGLIAPFWDEKPKLYDIGDLETAKLVVKARLAERKRGEGAPKC